MDSISSRSIGIVPTPQRATTTQKKLDSAVVPGGIIFSHRWLGDAVELNPSAQGLLFRRQFLLAEVLDFA